jgi:hypothetical protein
LRRAFTAVAAFAVALVVATGACAKETNARIEGYSITLPPRWAVSQDNGTGVTMASLDPPFFGADAVECQVQLYKVAVTRDAFVRSTHKTFSASKVTTASLDTGVGRLEGTRFQAKLPVTGVLGNFAQLAGTPMGEAYFGGPPATPIAAVIVTFAGDGERNRVALRNKCATTIQSLRVAPIARAR